MYKNNDLFLYLCCWTTFACGFSYDWCEDVNGIYTIFAFICIQIWMSFKYGNVFCVRENERYRQKERKIKTERERQRVLQSVKDRINENGNQERWSDKQIKCNRKKCVCEWSEEEPNGKIETKTECINKEHPHANNVVHLPWTHHTSNCQILIHTFVHRMENIQHLFRKMICKWLAVSIQPNPPNRWSPL